MRRPESVRPGGEGDDDADEALEFDTVVLPARLDADVARRVAVASDRQGVSIADLLGRAAAAFDWSDPSEPRAGSR